MASLPESMSSSSSRPLALRMRPDLSMRQQHYHGKSYWVVKEPIGLNYFRFHEEEFAILSMLNGRNSMDDIKEQFEREFRPQKITFPDLQQFIGMLHKSGLVISNSSGQGRQLRKRGKERRRKETLGKFANVFAFRFRGIDPEWILNKLIPYTSWMFSVPAIFMVLFTGLCALTLVAVQHEEFQSRLPTFHQFFEVKNWAWLAVTMGVVKVIHEFGHGLSCKKYGGECHEMGFMLLVFTPCLFCNVSDSWMLPNKWHRIFIAAAGMYLEVFIASIATFLWWFSEPGLFNHLCLSVMFICSVSTLVFNGNPLLRFDGYYILMDFLEIPNLRQKCTEVLKRKFLETCMGIEQPENPFLPKRRQWLFAIYTISAFIYRWVVMISIMLFCNKMLEPYGLQAVGRILAVAGIFGILARPMYQGYKFFTTPGKMSKMKKHRVAVSLGVVAAIIAFVAYVPFPYHVNCAVEVHPCDAEGVFLIAPGKLVEAVAKPGQQVAKDQVLARMDNIDLHLKVAELEGQKRETETQLVNLRRQRFKDERANQRISQVVELLKAIEAQLDRKREELEQLQEIIAPIAGTVLAPPSRPPTPSRDGRLPEWSGAPMDNENIGAYLSQGDMLCQIGDPEIMEAVLIIDQHDVELVAIGDELDVKLDAAPNAVFNSKIEEIAKIDLKRTSASLASQAGGELDTRMDASGAVVPISTSYQARAPLETNGEILRSGYRGRAKIYTGWMSLGTRLKRILTKSFHFEL